jgi:hypothetical protein
MKELLNLCDRHETIYTDGIASRAAFVAEVPRQSMRNAFSRVHAADPEVPLPQHDDGVTYWQ